MNKQLVKQLKTERATLEIQRLGLVKRINALDIILESMSITGDEKQTKHIPLLLEGNIKALRELAKMNPLYDKYKEWLDNTGFSMSAKVGCLNVATKLRAFDMNHTQLSEAMAEQSLRRQPYRSGTRDYKKHSDNMSGLKKYQDFLGELKNHADNTNL